MFGFVDSMIKVMTAMAKVIKMKKRGIPGWWKSVLLVMIVARAQTC